MIDIQARLELFKQGYWEVPDNLDTTEFDFDWRPEPYDRPFIHQFGTQHQKTGGPKFIIPTAVDVKYQSHQHATRLPDESNRAWRPLKNNVRIDFSWHPDDTDPPYIYVFGNQWYDVFTMPSMQYRVKGATDKKYIDDIKATLVPETEKWYIPEGLAEGSFDYSWRPGPHEPNLIHQFGTQHQKTGGPKYTPEGAEIIKYNDTQVATRLPNLRRWTIPETIDMDAFDFSWHPDDTEPPFMYEFGTQWQKNGGPLYSVSNAIIKKYCDAQVAIRLPNLRRWTIPESIDMDMFDFSWHPDATEPPFMYEFGTQWQKNGGPIFIARGATVTKYTDAQKAVRKPNMRSWRIIESIDSVNFDFSWHPDNTEEPYTYVFGNEYFPPEIMPTVMYRCRDSVGVKYITNEVAKLDIPKIQVSDSIFDSAVNHTFTSKYVHFYIDRPTTDYKKILPNIDHKPYLHILNEYEAIVPNDIVHKLHDKLMDYPEVFYHRYPANITPLDIVFFSNGESCAEDNYKHLLELTKNLPNKVHRVDKVNGRVKSQHAAAHAAQTPWYFLVNAKLKVKDDFDFGWQPNRMKGNRHYIFTCTNQVNGLEYGHQAIVVNNRRLTLNTEIRGLDFTMDSPTEVLNINSGITMYNSSEYDTWRTSFRECIKLKYYNDADAKLRLNTWATVGNGTYGDLSILGANDAIGYYDSVNGELEKLMLTYDWDWLNQYYRHRYP